MSLIADPITVRFQACFWVMGMLVCLTCIYPLPAQGAQTPPEPQNGTLTINLYEAILLSLRNNRTVTSAYMDRVLSRFDFAREKAKFSPNFDIDITADITSQRVDTQYSESDSAGVKTESTNAGMSGTITQKVPTGAEFVFSWAADFAKSWDSATNDDQEETKKWSASFSQPLLKNGGIDYNTASIKRADMDEQENLLRLRDTVITTVSATITSFRNFLQARKNLENQQQSLTRAQEQLRINELLIKTGRMAESEIYETQANVARQELSFEQNKNALDQARLTLLDVLDLDSSLAIDPIMDVSFKPIEPEFETCLQAALTNSATIISARNAVKKAELSVMEAKNQRLWDLNIDGSIGQTASQYTPGEDTRNDEWQIGASVTAPFHLYGQKKYDYEKELISARINLHKAQLSLKEIEDDLRTDILNAVRNVHSALKQVKLARQSLNLSEKAFATDQLKLRLGRISNKDFISSQDTLTSAQKNEVDTIIAYLNTLTSLDQTLATTLDTYKIAFQPTRPEIEERYMGRLEWMLNQ
ncbi:TolC family protein [Desulfoplanes sp. PS50]